MLSAPRSFDLKYSLIVALFSTLFDVCVTSFSYFQIYIFPSVIISKADFSFSLGSAFFEI